MQFKVGALSKEAVPLKAPESNRECSGSGSSSNNSSNNHTMMILLSLFFVFRNNLGIPLGRVRTPYRMYLYMFTTAYYSPMYMFTTVLCIR